jgi:carboxylate-amine ligase
VEHSFTGPPYTIGVEEELMIVDAETLDLSNSIESLLKGIPQDLVGEVKPELLESVCEIATAPPALIRSRCGRTPAWWRGRATAS